MDEFDLRNPYAMDGTMFRVRIWMANLAIVVPVPDEGNQSLVSTSSYTVSFTDEGMENQSCVST